MASLPVEYIPSDDLFSNAAPVCGVLTTEHAASSYGMPVFVREDGTVLGAAELPHQLHATSPHTAGYSAWISNEASAADDVACGWAWAPSEFAGQKYQDGVIEMLEAARRAGYQVYRLFETQEQYLANS